jgi:nitrogen fixation protein FixH
MTNPGLDAIAAVPVDLGHPDRPSGVWRFTGWHMLGIFVAFFGLVIVINVVMARLALATFSGEVVENSYVASQAFNSWLASARADRALGWQTALTAANGTLSVTLRDHEGHVLPGAELAAIASHPLGDPVQIDMRFAETAPGTYAAPLPAGRWLIHLTATAQGHRWRTMTEVNEGSK